MAHDGVSRRDFLKQVGALTVGAAAFGRLAAPAPAAAATPPGTLRFGVQTPPQYASYADMVAVWQEAEELGLDTAFTFDHLVPIFTDPEGPCLEGWTLLSALAAKTERLRVGVLVTGNTYRNPALLAKMATTVDHVSDGRLILGMGAGWFELEHEAYGFDFHTAGERARRLVEAVEIVKQLFTNERTTYEGRYYTIEDAPFEPKPVQRPHPPILIGGMGPKVIQPLAARHADVWHFFVRDGKIETARATCERFDQLCREAGRDPAAVEKAVFVRSDEMAGDGGEAWMRGLAGIGVRHFILSLRPPYDRALLRRFAEDVAPRVRETVSG